MQFGPAERRVVLLRGEALFEVAPEPARRFRVAAEGGVSEAVGTAFVVREDGDLVTVAVTHGVVAVASPEAPEPSSGAAVRVARGQQVTYAAGRAPGAPVPADPETAAAWRTGRLILEGTPFLEAMARLERYRPGRIVVLGDAARLRPVSGVFALDRLDEAIDGLAATQGLSVTRITSRLVILR